MAASEPKKPLAARAGEVADADAKATAAKSLTGCELAVPVLAVIAAYSSLLCGLHFYHARLKEAAAASGPGQATDVGNWWGTLPSAWDHPEPNYLVSEAIGEFWSVLTTIPVAGTMLLYVGFKYRYGAKVLRIYALTFAMYSLAFAAHLTLQKAVFSTTVTSVMSNAFLTFLQFGGIVGVKNRFVRTAVVLAAEVALISTVLTLPYKYDDGRGGVWTLFYVQSPGVFLATAIAGIMLLRSKRSIETMTYRTVFGAGLLLSTAMVLSLVECLYGFEYGIMDNLWGFPWLHIAIHVFEQVGIFFYGIGTAALQELLFEPEPREGAEVRYITALHLPYLYCPRPRGEAQADAPLPQLASATPAESGIAAAAPSAKVTASAAATAMPTVVSDSGAKTTPSLQKRKRDHTPGPPTVRPAS